jgi:hypothetical protein
MMTRRWFVSLLSGAVAAASRVALVKASGPQTRPVEPAPGVAPQPTPTPNRAWVPATAAEAIASRSPNAVVSYVRQHPAALARIADSERNDMVRLLAKGVGKANFTCSKSPYEGPALVLLRPVEDDPVRLAQVSAALGGKKWLAANRASFKGSELMRVVDKALAL